MSEKWTKGPWKVSEKFCDVRIVPDDYDQHVTIASMGNWQPEFIDEQRANARLIASAPDLYAQNKALAEALRELVFAANRISIRDHVEASVLSYCVAKAEAALRGALGE